MGLGRGIFKILNNLNKSKESVADNPLTSSQVSNSEFILEENIELLNIGDLQLDTSSEGTLQASLMPVIDLKKELEALEEDLKTKPLSSLVEEGKFPS